MKKILTLVLTAALLLAAMAVSLTSCGEKAGDEVVEGGDVSSDAITGETVEVVIKDNVNKEKVLDAFVEVTDGMTVLDAIVAACANNDIAYELSADEANMASINARTDSFNSNEETEGDMFWWHYTINDNDESAKDADAYAPSAKAVAAGDKIVWLYDAYTE